MRVLNLVMAVVAVLAVASLIVDVGGFALSPDMEQKLDVLNWIIVTIFVCEFFIE